MPKFTKAQLEGQLEALRAANADLRAELAQLEEDYALSDDRCNAATQRCEALVAENNALTQECDRLNKALRIAQAMEQVQAAKLQHTKTEHRSELQYSAYREACRKAREQAMRTGHVVRVG